MPHFKKSFRKRRREQVVSLALILSMLTGCTGRERALNYIGEPKNLDYYEDAMTRIEYPDVDQPTPDTVTFAQKPRTLGDRSRDEVWDMPLAEAIHLALANNKVIRTRTDFLSTNSQLYTNPDNVASVYDPAIRESGVLFGTRGVESALSYFDTQWNTNLVWGKNQAIQNNVFLSGGTVPGFELIQDTAQFSTGLTKNMAYGATASVTQNWNYLQTNQPNLLFPSVYTGNLQFNYTQPLWAGAGAEFTRIAGPLNTNLQAVSGVNQGVIIARINTDISIADFEIRVRNMLKDVEDLYWDLYLAYRTYDAQVIARNSALRTWREVKAKADIGARGGGAADEAQSREAYFSARAGAEDSLQNLYTLEVQLRRMCGLASTDGRIIRPADEPVTAEFIPDWHMCLAEALTRREELRRQKWAIKSYDLQLIAAKNLAHPQFNFVGGYQLNGFGNNLFGANLDEGMVGAHEQSAYRTLANANQSGWQAGFQFNMPFGLRNARSQVRNYELRVAKAREILSLQETEVSHELTNAFQSLGWRYKTAETNFNRGRAAFRQLQATDAEYKAGTRTLDLLLQAQNRLAQAQIAYYTSIVRYNQAITDVHFRKGTLLENNNVHLSEGLWTPEAYKDALRKAWARTYAFDAPEIDPVHHEPMSFVRKGVVSSAEVAGLPEELPPADGTMGVEVPQVPALPEAPKEAPIGPVAPGQRPLSLEPRPLPPAEEPTAPSPDVGVP